MALARPPTLRGAFAVLLACLAGLGWAAVGFQDDPNIKAIMVSGRCSGGRKSLHNCGCANGAGGIAAHA